METPLNNGHAHLYMGRWKNYDDFRRWMSAERRRARITQAQLAKLTGVSRVSIRKIELGHTRDPKSGTVAEIITALEHPGVQFATQIDAAAVHSQSRRGERSGEVLMPVYRWGARGDPRAESSRPLPESKEYPAGGASVVGSRGFGVIVSGEHLAGFGIHERDVAWCNPDDPPSSYMPVVVLREGLEVEALNGSRDGVIGPVVWVTPSGHPPQRPLGTGA